MIRLIALLGLLTITACGGSSPSAPTPTPPTPVPVVVSLTGTVVAFDGKAIQNATVTILDGANAGKVTTTTSGGAYSFTGLTASNANVSASRTDLGFTTSTAGVVITGAAVLNFVLQAPAFVVSTSGNTVVSMPVYVSKVRIFADYGDRCQNFILKINGSLVVNEILGSCSVATTGNHFDGTFIVPNKSTSAASTIETTNSTGVAWSVNEVR